MKYRDFMDNLKGKLVKEDVMDWGDDEEKPAPKKKVGPDGKPEKEVKTFNVGDVITLKDTKKSTKIPADAWDFLMTYKTFTVKKVNDKGKIDLGCNISKNEPDGTGVEKKYMFSPNRFELKDAAPVPETKPEKEEGMEGVEVSKEEEFNALPYEEKIKFLVKNFAMDEKEAREICEEDTEVADLPGEIKYLF